VQLSAREGETAMLRADFLVLTVPRTVAAEAAYPVMASYWLPDPKPSSLYGFRGYRCGKVFIGEREDRYLVQATGAIAHDVALAFPLAAEHELSVARIDVQITFVVRDADFFILACEPSKAYKSVRWCPVGEQGQTLYVGAPKSDCRLRIYNKTAESGIKPQSPGDFVRFELQFRNNYADRMFRAIRARAPKFPFLSHLRRMVDSFSFDTVKRHLESLEDELFPEEEIKDVDAISRRKLWLERSVIPALRKVLAEEPEYWEVFTKLLDNPLDGVV
jgi:hypothetical protein